MVYYNPSALEDYSNILYGLLTWPKHPLEPEHAKQYMHDIDKICHSLNGLLFHQKATYDIHKRYGCYIYMYRRNRNTSWYIIYNKDLSNNIFIERIMNNYMTVN
ncbi:hypothetical protein FACS1894145_1250 [Bacteroidia bacterium]|nr:hypothetical protein FACS1894145_1250 [Bacteroidia bacterium]